ncbi:MAG: tetratricopeptide repeat protein [Spirochaetales bacterium]|nr:tetratricopeptide repeat protein [Spirochaetales bacterium]
MYLILVAVPIILQVLCIVHAVKTGRPGWWIYVIIFIPLAGGIAYLIVEILPSLLSGHTRSDLRKTVIHTLNPQKKIEELKERLEESDTFLNRKELADEYMKQGGYLEAESLYRECLSGPYADDVYILHGLAGVLYHLGRFGEAEAYLLRIKEKDGRFESYDVWLLYADVLASSGKVEAAEDEYRILETSYPGLKAMYHYGEFLRKKGRKDEAVATFRRLVTLFSRMQHFNRRTERIWEQKARAVLREMESGFQ